MNIALVTVVQFIFVIVFILQQGVKDINQKFLPVLIFDPCHCFLMESACLLQPGLSS